MAEEWRPVVGFEGVYDVSNLGRVRRVAAGKRTRPGKILIPGSSSALKYPCVGLFRNGVRYGRAIHVLVAEAFVGPKPPGMRVSHRNHDPLDARAENLEYLTPSELLSRAYREGRREPKRPEPRHQPAQRTGHGEVAIYAAG